MKEILDEGNVPEAVFVTGDEAAIGALNAICDAGYRVPEDISIAGFFIPSNSLYSFFKNSAVL